MNGYVKGALAAIGLGILGVLGNGWLSHADKDDVKIEKAERVKADEKLEKKDEKIVELIANVQEKVAENSKINAVQLEVLKQLKEELEEK